MATVNKVFLIGNLTRDPELRYTPSGSAVCEFGIAINRVFTSNNERKEETCFVDVNAWGRQAENCAKYLQKGSSVCIEGRLHLDQWEDRETGRPRSKLKVVAERTQFLGAPARRDDRQQQGGYDRHPGSADNNSYPGTQNNYQPPAGATPHSEPSPTTPPDAPFQKHDQAPPPPPAPAADPTLGTEDDIPF